MIASFLSLGVRYSEVLSAVSICLYWYLTLVLVTFSTATSSTSSMSLARYTFTQERGEVAIASSHEAGFGLKVGTDGREVGA